MPQPGHRLNPIALNIQSDCPGFSGRKNNIITAVTQTNNSKFCKNEDQYFLNLFINFDLLFSKNSNIRTEDFNCDS